MRLFAGAVLVVALGLAWLAMPGGLGSPAPAQATHGKVCGAVAKGSRDYLVLAKRVSCKRGRKGAKRWLRKRKSLRGFRCKRNVGKYRFVCKKRTRRGVKSYRAERL